MCFVYLYDYRDLVLSGLAGPDYTLSERTHIVKTYQFPEKNQVWDLYESEGSNELKVEIRRRHTRADITIALYGPASEAIYNDFAFSWTKVLYSPEFPMSKLDYRFVRGLSPTACYIGNVPVQMVQHLADRLVPDLLWYWEQLKGWGYEDAEEDSACARVVGRAN